ncbi:MAG: T9SS type A sorting domain-containing protein [Bacteroidota bacterium]|nr:T9SS type A sorting domain-containing protein [Bacteroidota bacterium]
MIYKVKIFSLFISVTFCCSYSLFSVVRTSVTSGSYNTSTTWSPIGIPSSGDKIIVSSGHTITLSANSVIKDVTILSGGVLDNNSFTLKIASPTIANPTYENNGVHNGTGNFISYDFINLEMSGSGIVNCPIEISSYGLLIKNTCNLTINNNVFHSVPGNSGMDSKYFIDCSQGGRLTINGNIITDPNYLVSILNALGTIIINGDVDFDGFAGSHIDNSDSLIITGNLYLGTNFSYFWNMPNGVALTTVASIGGDVLGAGSGQTFFFQEAYAVIKFGGQVFPFSADGDLFASGMSLLTGVSVEPNIIEYNGSSTQIIKAPSDGTALGGTYTLNTYSILKINNSSSTGINLPGINIDVNDTLFLTDGLVNTGTNEVYVKNNATNSIINHSDTSYINGNLRRNISSSGGSYDLPVGNSTSYQLATTNLTGAHTVGNLLVNFSNLTSGTGLPLIEGANNFSAILNCGGISSGVGNSNDGVWTITPDAGTANYDLTLYGKNYSNQGSVNTIVKRGNSSSSWFLTGSYVVSAGSEPLIASRNSFSGFSQFAIASTAAIILPIELLNFSSHCVFSNNKKTVELQWSTIAETNNSHFTIEKSNDAFQWKQLGIVQGTGNANQNNYYFFLDSVQAIKDVTYYRLTQTDFNGTEKIVGLLFCDCNLTTTTKPSFFPNPITDNLNIKFGSKNQYTLTITDVLGNIIKNETFFPTSENDYMLSMDTQTFTTGIYFISIMWEDRIFTEKVIKK